MNKRKQIWEEVELLPDAALDELLEFVSEVKQKASTANFDTARASEPALGRDWLRPEEDAAWSDL